MKKVFTLSFVLLAVIFLAGCTEQNNQNTNTSSPVSTTNTNPATETGADTSVSGIYENSTYGFSLEFSATWGEIKEQTQGSGTDFNFVSIGLESFNDPARFINIIVINNENRAELLDIIEYKTVYVTENSTVSYYYSYDIMGMDEDSDIQKEVEAIIETFSLMEESTELLSSYSNDRLNIKFDYPQDWGTISEQDELPLIGQVTLRFSDDIFLSADNGYRSGDRGSYWGDYASFLKDQSTISNFCQEPFTSPERIKKCSIITNNNAITYAKTEEEICTEAGCSGLATNYYFYNPNSEFRGFVISSALISDNNFDQLVDELDKLVNNLDFIKSVEVTGEFNYYISEAPTYLAKTALGKVCFTPAQLETVNDGVMFCFTNTEAALAGLNIPADESCNRYYWGDGTIEIQNLTNNVPAGLKTDACFAEGSCLFNEAEFVKVVNISHEAECKK